jgi:hypothetical protein
VRARIIESKQHIAFAEAFQRVYREKFSTLDNRTCALVNRTLTAPQQFLRSYFESAVAKQKGKSTISLTDGLALLRAYQIDEESRNFAQIAPALIAEDDNHRYITDRNLQIKLPMALLFARM